MWPPTSATSRWLNRVAFFLFYFISLAARDYDDGLARVLSYDQGFTFDQLLRKKLFPPLVLRIKLKIAIETGRVAVDNRLEGVRYFKNLLLL